MLSTTEKTHWQNRHLKSQKKKCFHQRESSHFEEIQYLEVKESPEQRDQVENYLKRV